jgi:hypothetical protein
MYIIAFLLFIVLIIGHEFFWRYEPELSLKREIHIQDGAKHDLVLHIEEENNSPVDTVRRDMKDTKTVTHTAIFLSGAHDTVFTSIAGKYFSDFRPVHLASDSSSQIMLIPNSSQGLPAGWTRIIYLKNDSSLAVKEFSGYFIGDIDNDGNEEINIPEKGWMKLDVNSGDWVAAKLMK